MSSLDTSPRFSDGDAFYAALVEALDEAGDDGALVLLARLTLILANQVGDQRTLMDALALARRPANSGSPDAG
ncbi:MAG TPA: DUF2783 domain-containing protein [Phenylobacterium sp.]|nr:DUF2783 domain-containing protein [Phenylobacterium sp.]